MISRLKVELEKVTPFREDLNGYRNVFTPKLPFKYIQTDMPQASISSCLMAVPKRKLADEQCQADDPKSQHAWYLKNQK